MKNKKFSLLLILPLALLFATSAQAAQNRGAEQLERSDSEVVNGTRMMIDREDVDDERLEDRGVRMMDRDEDLDDGTMMDKETQRVRLASGAADATGAAIRMNQRSEEAIQHMSQVATQVQMLLENKGLKGGIGDQVRVIAQEQVKVQSEIKNQLEKVDSRSDLVKSLIGPDFKAMTSIQELIASNSARLAELEQLKTELTSDTDIQSVEETIAALTDQNTALQDRLNLENSSRSLFGWLFRLFSK